MEQFGRYFLLENFVSEEKKALFESCVEDLRNINPAVQQDIEDTIICYGFTPDKNRNDPAIKEAKEKLYELNIYDNSDYNVKFVRPPELWNYPEAVQKHKFRSIAKPKDCYLDGRIEALDEKLNQLKEHLISFKPQNWREFVLRIVDVFKDQYNKEVSAD
ncbi:hypothetical protein IMG5_201530 [Ichthyophthirius multifiliis]|uniref:Uncharacterized protein n=1 Tax=Ichthyophthirius multifiliis TaxID=5932 RepID=G0R604_ICHMU|nr:hypothetical protein IMG5_201530 [Ichthyophthirius multifiliis]EGR27128.1 hypothetical protein IMG5_201530 [Ichthyophthirius multifiliis]|eukprot:XP_004024012.1 hypothetical protein IMG5_201530 [Ichthyophthirius multifiliis]